MFLLIPYIIQHRIDLRLANRKCRVPSLPCKLLISWRKCLYPTATVSLHLFDNMRHRFRLRKHHQRMHMVLCSAHSQNLTTSSVDQLANISMQLIQMPLFYQGAAGLHVEDYMQIDFTKRLRHYLLCFCPFGAVFSRVTTPPRALPWADRLSVFQTVFF